MKLTSPIYERFVRRRFIRRHGSLFMKDTGSAVQFWRDSGVENPTSTLMILNVDACLGSRDNRRWLFDRMNNTARSQLREHCPGVKLRSVSHTWELQPTGKWNVTYRAKLKL